MPTGPNKHKFTIYFDVPEQTFEILNGLGKRHGVSPHEAAHDILMAWMAEVEKAVEPKEEPRIIVSK